MTTIHDCWQFTTELGRQGVPVPKALSDVIESYEAMESAADAGTAALTLEADLAVGKAKPADLTSRFDEAVRERVYRSHAAATLEALTPALVNRFVDAIRGKAGEQILTSLRPRFDTAIDAIRSAGGLFGPSSEPAHILAMGAEAATVYNALPAHRATLDAILTGIVYPLSFTFEATGERTYSRQTDALVAWLVNPETPDAISRASHAFAQVGQGNPGGRWHWLVTAADVRLNTPAEAAAILDHLDESTRAERDRMLDAMNGGDLSALDIARLA